MRPGGSPAARGVSARGLARQIALCGDLPDSGRLVDHPLRPQGSQLYPEPHSPLFDFESTARGAEWIDELAFRAAVIRAKDTSTPVVAHTDWSARNVRFDEKRLLAVYDWDSLAVVQESAAVGQAAMTWSVTADPGGTEFPALESVLAYLDDFEREREAALTSVQRRAARASAAWVLAYTARCEHSVAARGLARTDQTSGRERLAEVGEELLSP
jgi:aminoglycoside phosphotransferase (APT) family kinase protein